MGNHMETALIVVSGLVAGISCLTTSYLLGRRLVRTRRAMKPRQAGVGTLPKLDDVIGSEPLFDPAPERSR